MNGRLEQNRELLRKIRVSKRILRVCCIVMSILTLLQMIAIFIRQDFLPLVIAAALTLSIVTSFVAVSREERKMLAKIHEQESLWKSDE